MCFATLNLENHFNSDLVPKATRSFEAITVVTRLHQANSTAAPCTSLAPIEIDISCEEEDDEVVVSQQTTAATQSTAPVASLFDVLPNEMRSEILAKLVEEKEWKTLIVASKVNSEWKMEINRLWRLFCEQNKMLDDEEIWNTKGKNWKWVCMCLSKVFAKEDHKEGCGITLSAPLSNTQQPQQAAPVNNVAPVITPTTEARYEGEFKDNKKEGVGRIWWSNGDRYLGDWKHDTKDGFGVMMWENGDRYDGNWKNDLRDGQAKYTYANGGVFLGGYLNDERHGDGAFVWPDGDRFEGTWKSGGRTGAGVLILKDGSRITQEWNESPYVNYSDSLPAKHTAAIPFSS